MTGVQYDRLMMKLTKELEEYKKNMLEKPAEEIYDSFYEISVYEEFYNYIDVFGESMDYKGFPNKHILDDFYNQFMKTDYSLSNEDLADFFHYQIKENIDCKRFEEM